MAHATWRPAADVLADPDGERFSGSAFELWAWLGAGQPWTPSTSLADIARKAPGVAAFAAAVLELDPGSPILAALEAAGAAGVYELAGFSTAQAQAHELWLAGCSHQAIAAALGCSESSVRSHLKRAGLKLRQLVA